MQASPEVERQVEKFLYREAELLDSRQFDQWLESLAEDMTYEMPLRVTCEGGRSDMSSKTAHFLENRRTLELRVKRLKTDYAWAENPPSRTRRFVSNVRVEATANLNEVIARSYFLIYRSRGSSTDIDLISGERVDLLRGAEGDWKLAKRTIIADQAVLGTQNLAIFL